MMYYAHKAPSCDELSAKFPNAATYIDGQLIIVGESFCDVREDLSQLELSNSQIDVKIDELLAVGGKELVLSKAQGLYLYNKHKPVVEEEVL